MGTKHIKFVSITEAIKEIKYTLLMQSELKKREELEACLRQLEDLQIVHQTKVFAGATMEFQGAWIIHPKFGRQFKATKAIERKPATTAALELSM